MNTRLITCQLAVRSPCLPLFGTQHYCSHLPLAHLCMYQAPAKIHSLQKLLLNHFPALAPIAGIEVAGSKRKGMQSISFACHQCDFAARQLEQETQTGTVGMAREPGSSTSQAGGFLGSTPLSPDVYQLHLKSHYRRIQHHKQPEK